MTEDERQRRASWWATGRAIAEARVSLNEMVERLAALDLDARQRRLMEDGITAGRLLQANMDSSWRIFVASGEVPRDLCGPAHMTGYVFGKPPVPTFEVGKGGKRPGRSCSGAWFAARAAPFLHNAAVVLLEPGIGGQDDPWTGLNDLEPSVSGGFAQGGYTAVAHILGRLLEANQVAGVR